MDTEHVKKAGVDLAVEIAAWRAEKRASKRWSTGWHRADAAIAVLVDLRRRLAVGSVGADPDEILVPQEAIEHEEYCPVCGSALAPEEDDSENEAEERSA